MTCPLIRFDYFLTIPNLACPTGDTLVSLSSYCDLTETDSSDYASSISLKLPKSDSYLSANFDFVAVFGSLAINPTIYVDDFLTIGDY